MSAEAYDLNDPYDARSYVALWISRGGIILEIPLIEQDDDAVLRLARKLFLMVDEDHPCLGGAPH